MIPVDESDHRAWLASLVDVQRARVLVDLGCGTGKDLARIAEHAEPDARLVGIDAWPAQLQGARALLHPDRRVSFVEHEIGSGPLPFDDATIDVVLSNNALECVADPLRVPHEVARVLRPNGQVVCAHWDWDSQTIDVDDKVLARHLEPEGLDTVRPRFVFSASAMNGKGNGSTFTISRGRHLHSKRLRLHPPTRSAAW